VHVVLSCLSVSYCLKNLYVLYVKFSEYGRLSFDVASIKHMRAVAYS